MTATLQLEQALFEDLRRHLFPARARNEEAAFLFAQCTRDGDDMTLRVVAARKMTPGDFAAQTPYYLELTDETRASLIKQAHDLGASLVEMHSHPHFPTAEFSDSDRAGLIETVPHMWWRLAKRPYLALVLTRNTYDALLWFDNSSIPQRLDGIQVGGQLLKPTNLSLEGWD